MKEGRIIYFHECMVMAVSDDIKYILKVMWQFRETENVFQIPCSLFNYAAAS